MRDRNGRTIGMSLDKSVLAHIEGAPASTKKKRERMSTRRKLWLLGASLLVLGVLMMLSSIPLGLVGVWSGDERWSVTGVILFFSGVFSGLIGGMTTDFNRS